MPIDECKAKHTSSQFVLWIAFLEKQWSQRKPEHFYLAQIAAEIRRSNVKHPRRIKTDSFLLTFIEKAVKAQSKADNTPPTPEEIKQKTSISKAFWGAVVSNPRSPSSEKQQDA